MSVTSWALYDFANTVFYAVVVTRYLSVQLEETTGRHMFINYGIYPSMAVAAFLAPWLGRYAGARGLCRTTVFLFTIICCVFTAALGPFENPWALVGIFALALAAYQLALVPYNNLLPSVASPKRMGLVSGLGVGIGYLGVIVSLQVCDMVIKGTGAESFAPAYYIAAVAFFLFTLPLLFFVPEKVTVSKEKKLSFGAVMSLMKDRACRRFVVGNFLCSDALNAILFLISVYALKGLGFNSDELLKLLIVLNVSAMLSGVLFGFLTDRISPCRAMPMASILLLVGIGITHFSGNKEIAFWSIVLLGGPGVAGLWVAGRKWVVELAPPGDVGTLFGFYGFSNKMSLVNLTLFSFLADWTGNYTSSVVVLLVSLVVGTGFLLRVGSPDR